MNNAKETNKSAVQGDTGTMDDQKKNMLIGAGIGGFVLLMLIIYMFSGGTSDTKKGNSPRIGIPPCNGRDA